MSTEQKTVFAAALAVALLDWALKAWIRTTYTLGEFVQLAERLAIFRVDNDEMMLGLWGAQSLAFRQAVAIAGAAGILALVLCILRRLDEAAPALRGRVVIFAALMLAGTLGNLGERAYHWVVTDFLSVRIADVWMPPANLADLAMFCALGIAATIAIQQRSFRPGRGTTTSAALAIARAQ